MKTPNRNIDKILIERLQSNDESALTELYSYYWKYLYTASYNILKNKELCEDIIQEVFLSIWNNRAKLKIKVSLKGYLYSAMRYQAFAHLKKNKKMLRADLFSNIDNRIQYNSPETQMMYRELVQQIGSIVETLPEKCKKVYVLSRNEELTHSEISNILDISPKTVENHITKALRILKTSMGSILIIVSFLY